MPAPLHHLSSRRVLTLEWIEGSRLRSAGDAGTAPGRRGAPRAASPGSSSSNSSSSVSDLDLVDVGVRCSLEQMMECGFFHAGTASAI